METSEMRPPPAAHDFPATGVNSLASLWQRLGGWTIDVLVTIVPATVAVLPFIDLDKFARTGDLPTYATAIPLIVWLIYSVVLLTWMGRTLGCWVCGIKVVRYADGGKPTLDQAAMRSLLPASIAAIPIPIVNAGWIVVYMGSLYNPLRRGFQDYAGGTVVIRTR
jgi:uncharacterized RDD family membrane protein YckC